MRRIYIPSVANQTNKNFKVNISVSSMHADLIFSEFEKNKIPYIKSCTPDVAEEINLNIQTRHDCDDYMAPDYVQRIQEVYSENEDKYEHFVMHAIPTKYWVEVNREYEIYTGYHDRRVSMFASVCQKKYNRNIRIFNEPHTALWKVSPNIINLGTGLVKLVIHRNNKFSIVSKFDRLILDETGMPKKNNIDING
jgi:hypothetical protein